MGIESLTTGVVGEEETTSKVLPKKGEEAKMAVDEKRLVELLDFVVIGAAPLSPQGAIKLQGAVDEAQLDSPIQTGGWMLHMRSDEDSAWLERRLSAIIARDPTHWVEQAADEYYVRAERFGVCCVFTRTPTEE